MQLIIMKMKTKMIIDSRKFGIIDLGVDRGTNIVNI